MEILGRISRVMSTTYGYRCLRCGGEMAEAEMTLELGAFGCPRCLGGLTLAHEPPRDPGPGCRWLVQQQACGIPERGGLVEYEIFVEKMAPVHRMEPHRDWCAQYYLSRLMIEATGARCRERRGA